MLFQSLQCPLQSYHSHKLYICATVFSNPRSKSDACRLCKTFILSQMFSVSKSHDQAMKCELAHYWWGLSKLKPNSREQVDSLSFWSVMVYEFSTCLQNSVKKQQSYHSCAQNYCFFFFNKRLQYAYRLNGFSNWLFERI